MRFQDSMSVFRGLLGLSVFSMLWMISSLLLADENQVRVVTSRQQQANLLQRASVKHTAANCTP